MLDVNITTSTEKNGNRKNGLNNDITDFLLTEYDNVAKAFFNTYDLSAKWIRVYFIFLAVPFGIGAFVLKNSTVSSPPQIELSNLPGLVSVSMITIGLLGLFISYIVIDLRMDGILYARTANGIRKYFVDFGGDERLANLTKSQLQKYVVLPTDIAVPKFFKLRGDFLFLVAAMAVLNALYFGLGAGNFIQKYFVKLNISLGSFFWASAAIFVIIHFLLFWNAGRVKEKHYCNSQL